MGKIKGWTKQDGLLWKRNRFAGTFLWVWVDSHNNVRYAEGVGDEDALTLVLHSHVISSHRTEDSARKDAVNFMRRNPNE